MRLALIANRAAGGGTDVDAIVEALRAAGAKVTVQAVDGAPVELPTTRPDRYVVASGDGGIGPVAAMAAAAPVPLAVLPTGTANDFARALGLPSELQAAARLAADPRARTRAVELLRAGERPFVNAASAGLSVDAARRAAPLKRVLGPLAYAAGAAGAALTAPPLACRAEVDGRVLFDGPAWQVMVTGTGAFGAGARLDVADAGDGLLDVAVVAAGSRSALARRALAMRSGALSAQPGVHHARGRQADLGVPDGTCFNVDGELCRVEPPCFRARGERVDVVVG